MQPKYIASNTRRKGRVNDNASSNPTPRSVEAYAIRKVADRARVSPMQAAVIAELAGLLREARHGG